MDSHISLIAGQTNFPLDVESDGNYNLFLLVWPKDETTVQTAWTITTGDVVTSGWKKKYD